MSHIIYGRTPTDLDHAFHMIEDYQPLSPVVDYLIQRRGEVPDEKLFAALRNILGRKAPLELYSPPGHRQLPISVGLEITIEGPRRAPVLRSDPVLTAPRLGTVEFDRELKLFLPTNRRLRAFRGILGAFTSQKEYEQCCIRTVPDEKDPSEKHPSGRRVEQYFNGRS
jgi:hypothetical protein